MSRLMKQMLSNVVGYSMLPLRTLAALGLLGISVSIFLTVFYLCRYFLGSIRVSGWTTLLLVLLALSSFNFFGFALFILFVVIGFKRTR